MEQNHGGENLDEQPEHGEQLRINSIIIPAVETDELRQDQLGSVSLDDRQQLVGGLIEPIDLTQPPARMYVNEEGKMLGLPVNRRATLLAWAHNRAIRYHDVIVGDAFLVGRVEHGRDTPVSDEFVETLFEATRFRAEVLARGHEEWREQGAIFDSWIRAYDYALRLGRDTDRVADVRVVREA
jgi:hypothetical protein